MDCTKLVFGRAVAPEEGRPWDVTGLLEKEDDGELDLQDGYLANQSIIHKKEVMLSLAYLV